MKFKIVGFLFTRLFCAIFFLSCNKEPSDCKDFNGLSRAEKKEAAKKNSIETNFALMRCAYYIEGGPSPIADEPIIDGGQSSVPFLLSKLNSEDEDEQYRAISLLFQIDFLHERLQNRAEIIDKIEMTIDKMKDKCNRNFSLDRLEKMKNPPPPGAPFKIITCVD